MDFLNNLQLDQNQLLNVVLHKAATPPTSPAPVSGQLYYDTALNTVFYYTGAAWVDFGGDITGITAGAGLSGGGTGGLINLDINVDGSTIEIFGDIVRIKAAGVTSNELGTNSVTSVKILDTNISFQKIQDIPTMTVIGRVAAGTGVASSIAILNEANLASNSATALATQQSIKAYVDSSISSLGTLIGSYTPTGTTFPGTTGNDKGDYWYVTGSGTVSGITMNSGDLVIANKVNPSNTTPNDFIFLESNRDQATTTILGVVQLASSADIVSGIDNTKAITPAMLLTRSGTTAQTGLVQLATVTEVATGTDALKAVTPATLITRSGTTTQTGLVQLATGAEASAGTDTFKVITPQTLKSTLDAGAYAVNVGDNAASTFIVTHNLNTLDVTGTLIEIATGKVCYCDMLANSVNQLTISFTRIPTLNKYRIIIKK